MILEMQLSNSTTDELSYTYIARGLTYVGEDPEEDEKLTIRKLPFDEVYKMVIRGEIRNGVSVGSVLKAKVLLDEGRILSNSLKQKIPARFNQAGIFFCFYTRWILSLNL